MRKVYVRIGRIIYWIIWPGSWLYLRRSRRTRLLLVCNDEILAVKNWLSDGEWKLPGGGLNRHEAPAAGMARELYEETGIRLEMGTIRSLSTEMYRLHGFRYMSHFFFALADVKPQVKVNPYEIVGFAWLKRSEISEETCGPDVMRALELAGQAGLLDRH